MKFFMVPFLIAAIAVSAIAKAEATPAVLSAYSESAKYAISSYNFVKMSQDPEKTRNRVHILYQLTNEIETQTVVGDLGTIVDLGERSCGDMPEYTLMNGTYPGKGHGGYPFAEDRVEDPMFWLSYSPAWRQLTESRQHRIKPEIGHCYLTHLAGHDGITVAMFRVVGLIPGQFMVINEMELFAKPQN
jgi:hypothetical protein